MRSNCPVPSPLSIAVLVIALTVIPGEPHAAQPAADSSKVKEIRTIWIYRNTPAKGKPDTRTETERLFEPFGLMPPSRTSQISVNPSLPIDPKDPSKGTCIEYLCEFKDRRDWMGSYSLLEGGTAWGTSPGINVQKVLGVRPDTKVALRFKAKGEGVVAFKIGGVNTGPHKSSLALPREVNPSPTRLTAKFREYIIGPIVAKDLTNLIDPFCMVTSGLDNPGRDTVRVFVDDIRLEAFEKTKKQAALPESWRERLAQTFFVCYTPTGFDPTKKRIKEPTADDIRADLAAIRALADRAGINSDRAGIITYGCRNGLEQIAPLAREARLSVLLGVFNPRDSVEVENAEALLRQEDLQETIVGCCVGNEAITFRRATLDDIQMVVERLRQVCRVPMTSTEIVASYGDQRLFSFDFTLVNAHAIFAEIYTPDKGARWALERVRDLLAAAPREHLILVKELGWPAGPGPAFDDKQQAMYWRTVLTDPVARQVNVCIFDGLHNVPWKNEMITLPGGNKVNIGPHWPVLFDADRKPKPFANDLLALWEKTRAR
jgi:exo-beta-1,3-glucanase (GH17 family)